MPGTLVSYDEIRPLMKPGDIVAFSGKGGFSELIKWATRASVSHVGIVLQTVPREGDAPDGDFFNQVIESNHGDGFVGVEIHMLSERVKHYDGSMWWLPLSDGVRKKLDGAKFLEFCLRQNRKPYDMPQAIASALDVLDDILPSGALTNNAEDFEKFFCSELAAAALEAAGAIPSLNSAEVTPIDLCMFKIFQKDYVQFKGESAPIRGYNSVDPAGWGE